MLHTFTDGCGTGESPIKGDWCDDTPWEAYENIDCPEGTNTCPSDGEDPIHNYMDYTSDECRYEFTPNQVSRMQEQMAMYRPEMNGSYVTLDQKSESGSILTNSQMWLWNDQVNLFQQSTVPAHFNFIPGTQKTIKGSQEIISNQKYNHWVRNQSENIDDIKNHQGFDIDEETSFFTSSFKQSFSNISISNLLDGVGSGGSVYFRSLVC